MRKFIAPILIAFPVFCFAQIGIKAGLNFANVKGVESFNNSNETGFQIGVFLAPPTKGIIGNRTELLFSRQGYNYSSGTNTGTVNLDYIMLPTSMAINITKFCSILLGFQMAYLINAKVDSTTNNPYAGTPYADLMSYYNRFDYGFGAGLEFHPFKGLVVGGKYNISLGQLYKEAESGQMPSFADVDAKNNLVQIFAGWIFGKTSSNHKNSSK
jgi:outer membrane protein with beta-barrel domain